ncbi:MAG: nucleoside deaminase [Gemmatimonadales bacterium]
MATAPPWPREIRVELPAWIDEVVDPSRIWASDDETMALVIMLARENVVRGTGGPFGAAIFEVGTGRLVGVGVNAVLRHQNSCLHAEMVAFMVAEAAVGAFSLDQPDGPGHELVTSCEPCAMCLGGVLWSGVRRVVCGASREDALALGFDEGPVFPESYAYVEERGVTFTRNVRQDEARAVLARYMAQGGPVYNG